VILLDVEMGGMTGVDALRPVRVLAPDVRVLIVTSFFDPLYEAQAVRDGASAFLIKAHAPLNLIGEIHRALAAPVRMSPLRATVDTTAVHRPNDTSLVQPVSPTPKRSFASRFGSWAAHVSTNLLRPTPVSTAESHT